jgi:hypothetical protein
MNWITEHVKNSLTSPKLAALSYTKRWEFPLINCTFPVSITQLGNSSSRSFLVSIPAFFACSRFSSHSLRSCDTWFALGHHIQCGIFHSFYPTFRNWIELFRTCQYSQCRPTHLLSRIMSPSDFWLSTIPSDFCCEILINHNPCAPILFSRCIMICDQVEWPVIHRISQHLRNSEQ